MANEGDETTMKTAHSLQTLTERNMQVVTNILNHNWEEEVQMVSSLLQSPLLIPEELRINSLIRGICDYEEPYYILSAALGIQRLKIDDKDRDNILTHLKKALFNEHGSVCMRVFITLRPYLKFPRDVDLFIEILNTKKSPLHNTALSWLVLNVNDKEELSDILKKNNVPEHLVTQAEQKMEKHCRHLAHGDPSPISIEVIDYVPSFDDFEAMLEKGEALSEFFDDLDTDSDSKLSTQEVQTFLSDIGKDIATDQLLEEMKKIGIGDSGKIDKDGFIELMFPRFNIQ